jgi:hypothetical protein
VLKKQTVWRSPAQYDLVFVDRRLSGFSHRYRRMKSSVGEMAGPQKLSGGAKRPDSAPFTDVDGNVAHLHVEYRD